MGKDSQIWNQNLKMFEEVIEIDEENGNTLWLDAIVSKMKSVCPSFKVYDGNVKKLV